LIQPDGIIANPEDREFQANFLLIEPKSVCCISQTQFRLVVFIEEKQAILMIFGCPLKYFRAPVNLFSYPTWQ